MSLSSRGAQKTTSPSPSLTFSRLLYTCQPVHRASKQRRPARFSGRLTWFEVREQNGLEHRHGSFVHASLQARQDAIAVGSDIQRVTNWASSVYASPMATCGRRERHCACVGLWMIRRLGEVGHAARQEDMIAYAYTHLLLQYYTHAATLGPFTPGHDSYQQKKSHPSRRAHARRPETYCTVRPKSTPLVPPTFCNAKKRSTGNIAGPKGRRTTTAKKNNRAAEKK
jgi:hypothetical protein